MCDCGVFYSKNIFEGRINKNNFSERKGVMKKRFKIICSLLAFCALLLCVPAVSSSAAQEGYESIPISVNGQKAEELGAVLIDSITYVPLRKTCDRFMDCEIYWNDSKKTAYVYSSDGPDITVKSGKYYINANGRSFYTVGAVLNINGSLYVPIRPLAKALGFAVIWDSDSRSADLVYTGAIEDGDSVYDQDELYWLSRIIEAEAGIEPFKGKIAVGNVVLNRVASKEYPNTIYGVIFDKKYGTQFTPAATGTVYNTPSSESIIAAKICLEGYEVMPNALYFFDPDIATSFWISENCTFITRIGGHEFYY